MKMPIQASKIMPGRPEREFPDSDAEEAAEVLEVGVVEAPVVVLDVGTGSRGVNGREGEAMPLL